MITAKEHKAMRATCDKAEKYARDTMAGKRNYLTAEESAHPDYAACNNDMRGKVEQFEILRDLPQIFYAYLSSDEKAVTVWTGLDLGNVIYWSKSRSGWNGATIVHIRATIGGKRYHGKGAGGGMLITLRKFKGE